MRKYSTPRVSYVELLLTERIAANECMELTVTDTGALTPCSTYTAVELGRPCCETSA